MLAFIDKRTDLSESLQLSLGRLGDDVEAQADDAQRAATAMWRDDPSAWSSDPQTQKTIADRLGWLRSPALMADSMNRLREFAAAVRRDGFTDVVLLGMGGSSLAPEVIRAVVGVARWPRFRILDSTHRRLRSHHRDPAGGCARSRRAVFVRHAGARPGARRLRVARCDGAACAARASACTVAATNSHAGRRTAFPHRGPLT